MVLINITFLYMVAISNGIRCQGFSFCLRAKGHSHVISDLQESLFGMNFAQLLPTPSKNRFTLMLRTSKMIVTTIDEKERNRVHQLSGYR